MGPRGCATIKMGGEVILGALESLDYEYAQRRWLGPWAVPKEGVRRRSPDKPGWPS